MNIRPQANQPFRVSHVPLISFVATVFGIQQAQAQATFANQEATATHHGHGRMNWANHELKKAGERRRRRARNRMAHAARIRNRV